MWLAVWFTNTPTAMTERGSTSTIARTRSAVMNRGLSGQQMNPSALAP
jgi:hypothetical protein